MEQFNWVLIITWVILPALRKPEIANSLLFVARDAPLKRNFTHERALSVFLLNEISRP